MSDPNAKSIGARLRSRRWDVFLERFPDIGEMRILDLGGTVEYWQRAPVAPASVVVVNLLEQESHDPSVEVVVGDACSPQQELAEERFDLVYSNSVLEHVGGFQRRTEMAEAVLQMGEHHWIQTPYRYFPLEPHWLFPGFQFLPVSARAVLASRWPFAWAHPSGAEAVRVVLETELISATEMAYLFPRSAILKERVAGMTKSLVAVR